MTTDTLKKLTDEYLEILEKSPSKFKSKMKAITSNGQTAVSLSAYSVEEVCLNRIDVFSSILILLCTLVTTFQRHRVNITTIITTTEAHRAVQPRVVQVVNSLQVRSAQVLLHPPHVNFNNNNNKRPLKRRVEATKTNLCLSLGRPLTCLDRDLQVAAAVNSRRILGQAKDRATVTLRNLLTKTELNIDRFFKNLQALEVQ